LRAKDKKLAAAIDRIGMIQRGVNPDIFASLIESIVGQQISAKAAATVTRRLRELYSMDAARLHAISIDSVQACGMSMRKASYIKGVAKAAMDERIDFYGLKNMDDEDVIKALTALDGVGVWTAEMLLIFSLQRPNIMSFGDLAIRRGMMRLYGHKDMPRERFERYARRYAPYGSVASLYLWEIYSEEV